VRDALCTPAEFAAAGGQTRQISRPLDAQFEIPLPGRRDEVGEADVVNDRTIERQPHRRRRGACSEETGACSGHRRGYVQRSRACWGKTRAWVERTRACVGGIRGCAEKVAQQRWMSPFPFLSRPTRDLDISRRTRRANTRGIGDPHEPIQCELQVANCLQLVRGEMCADDQMTFTRGIGGDAPDRGCPERSRRKPGPREIKRPRSVS
jgi:hypothetical protein